MSNNSRCHRLSFSSWVSRLNIYYITISTYPGRSYLRKLPTPLTLSTGSNVLHTVSDLVLEPQSGITNRVG